MPLPVLLVHGFASSFERNWRELGWVDLLADAGRDVIPVDLLGHGSAEKPHDPAAYTDLASRVQAALPEDGSPVQAIAFSLGARLLLEVASAHPDRFDKIVVGGVGENLFRRHDVEALAAAVERGDATPGGIAHLFVQYAEGSGNDRRALAACLRRPEEPLTAEQLGRITCPVLVVIGDQDFAGPADPLVDALPDAKLVVLRNTEHFGTPKSFGFIDASLEFLDAVPR